MGMRKGDKIFLRMLVLYLFLATGTASFNNHVYQPRQPMDSAVYGLFWPLYWSYQAWDKLFDKVLP